MPEVRVAVLGPEGTYTEKVALQKWENAELYYAKTIPRVFKRMAEGKADYGVVPVEDSAEGDVNESLDLLRDYDFHIIGEALTEVTHVLLGKKDEKSLKKISSHPQALAHCRKYLETYFSDLDLVPTYSTANAAQIASTDASLGAIAAERNAEIYGLNVLRREVHDWGSNLTRFFILAPEPITPVGRAKTSFILYPRDDKPGQLFKVLKEFAERKINLTKIVSRPSRGQMGEYIFYIDFEGNQSDQNVRTVLENIENLDEIRAIKILGSYPPYHPSELKPEEVKEREPANLIEQTFGFWDNPEDKVYDSL